MFEKFRLTHTSFNDKKSYIIIANIIVKVIITNKNILHSVLFVLYFTLQIILI